jgi:predicted nucleic acid-binding protein
MKSGATTVGKRMSNFFDINVLLYIVESGPKAVPVQELIDRGGTISVQVLNEFVRVCRRKFKFSFPEIADLLAPFKDGLTIVDLTLDCHERAFEIARDHKINIYDANIIAAAELSGCDVLYSEDMNDGQRIGRVTIRNPFK